MQYDDSVIQEAVKQLRALREEFETTRDLFGRGDDLEPPFGSLDVGGEAHRAVSSFHAGVHSELGHAVDHLDRCTSTLQDFAAGSQDTDAHNARLVQRAAGAGPDATISTREEHLR